jgi:hypothetical protein
MSRRTKLLITALFLVLLAIPVWHLVHTWHPANPLRFRQVGERLEKHPFGNGHDHWIQMEVRNTSDATVKFLVGTFRESETPESSVDVIVASAAGRVLDDAVSIPPGGAVEVNFQGRSTLSTRTTMNLHAGKWQPRQGSVNYGWVSGPQAQYLRAANWMHQKVPVSWTPHMPAPSLFVDTIEVEHSPRSKPALPGGPPR